jgi:hypothetical protein
MQTPTIDEMTQGFRDATAQNVERMMEMGQAWATWQIDQMKALESGLGVAVKSSLGAVEQATRAGLEMNRILLGAFVAGRPQDKAQA